MAFDPKINRNEKDAIGDPGDPIATNTTEAWTSISLLKAIAFKLGLGSGAVAATDVAQGSTTSGQTGGLVQGAVTTAEPTYTDAKTNPLSLRTDGNLRVADADAAALLTTIDSKLGDLKTYTDGLETLATALNGYVDGLETLAGSTNTLLTTQAGYLDGLEGLLSVTASSGSITALASSATSAQLLAANASRKGLMLTNTDANAVLIKYGTTASATSFTVRIPLNGYWEMPKPIYTGRIDAIWEADGSGSVYATEL